MIGRRRMKRRRGCTAITALFAASEWWDCDVNNGFIHTDFIQDDKGNVDHNVCFCL